MAMQLGNDDHCPILNSPGWLSHIYSQSEARIVYGIHLPIGKKIIEIPHLSIGNKHINKGIL
jgi:hypothetical protein